MKPRTVVPVPDGSPLLKNGVRNGPDWNSVTPVMSQPPTSEIEPAADVAQRTAIAAERQLVEERADEAMAAREGDVAEVGIAAEEVGGRRAILGRECRRHGAAASDWWRASVYDAFDARPVETRLFNSKPRPS